MDYYNKEGESLGNDSKNDNHFMVLLDGRDVKTVSDRYFGSWWNRHKGEIFGTIGGLIVGALAGLLVLGVALAALLGAVTGYVVGRFLLKDKFLKRKPQAPERSPALACAYPANRSGKKSRQPLFPSLSEAEGESHSGVYKYSLLTTRINEMELGSYLKFELRLNVEA